MKITKQQLKQLIKEEISKALSREEWFHKLWPDRKNSSIKDLHAEADAARKAGDHDKADAIDNIADHLDIQKDMKEPHDPKELIEVGEGEIKLVYEPENEYITVEASWMDSYPQISIELLQEMYNALQEIGRI